ncbi:low molecular weight protein arginine phosphatase [Paludicola sp. MB14-C6]|uniref:arsenate reductase/protein-tyrosine-phosphatase family protein n=1 Tax=Paludihabitans sp. MB14-C6 TaxID=3070656 RepID=UPI0027DB7198|nr:low molecular weight protein arginine phosphatase [Paludicola sp. MB14-C6]WMJ22364.1 low molecular weight protein arginine phosphatase [Paludicola sp. MB14-C6]
MINILVICTGNTCRSPMAEGIIRKLIADKKLDGISVSSMGLAAYYGDTASTYSVDVMQEIEIDIQSHRSKRVLLKDLNEANYIYVMTQQHKNVIVDACPENECKIKVLDIPDPFGRDIEQYRECRDALIAYFSKELEYIIDEQKKEEQKNG